MIDPQYPLIDLRDHQAYQSCHYIEATHLPWPDLQNRLNELPARPASLQLLGGATALEAASEFLTDKGYQILNQFDVGILDIYRQNHPGLVISGQGSYVLWSPSPLVQEFVNKVAKRSNSGQAVDIGCGGGRDSVFLAQHGWQMIAIDREQRVLSRAKQLAQSISTELAIDWRACSVESAPCLPQHPLDLIVMVRFLNRSVVAKMSQMLKPGGYVVIQTFVEGVEKMGSPKNPNFILQKGELAKTFSAFDVIVDRIDYLKDGRPVASFIAQKRESEDVRNER